ncbi:hypothetical protein JR316_0001579 [Psilocybe cubensis]|uniref:Uncharacterized protein n=1 Tax=Psilocybe cubensis TaxID=181762 RepID=A0ACB8HAC3_PSICU|nr:hypothetical protein JR316_0001579 [Psilocybe cubensis]KAH9484680.1 hypothetical protein JR316_0001579 [Psilocybe cubensis]
MISTGLRAYTNATFTNLHKPTIVAGETVYMGNGDVHSRNQELSGIVQWLTHIRSEEIHYDTLSKRTPGTGEWFLSSTQFNSWVSVQRSILLLDGKPGSGKTVLAAIVIEYLMEFGLSDDRGCNAVLFLYCRHNESWTISKYLGSLIGQMLTRYRGLPVVAEHVHRFYDLHQTRQSYPSTTELVTILSNIVSAFKHVRVVLDGLDELPDRDQIELVSILRALPASLLFTSRIIGFEVFDFPQDLVHMTIGDQNHEDIRLFLHETIPKAASVARILRRNEGFLEEICNKILNISGGMFLLATLRSQSLQGYTTMTSLSNSLDGLRDDVQSMYISLMDRINSQKGEYPSFAKRAITWIMYARRPLTIAELAHALAIREGENSFNERNIPAEDMITASSCGIIEIQLRCGTVRLVHHTAYEFLSNWPEYLIKAPHAFIGNTCNSYLTAFRFTTLEKLTYTAFKALVKSHDAPLLEYAYQNWTAHIRECEGESYPTETVHNFVLKTPNYPLFDSRIGFSWLDPSHVIAYHGLQMPLSWDGYCNLRTTKKHTTLTLAALNGCITVVKTLLECSCIDVNAQTSNGDTALILACKEGHKTIVNMLLLRKDTNPNLCNKRGLTALMYSSILGHIDIISDLLSNRKINTNFQDARGATALMHASRIGHLGAVRVLLSCLDVDINVKDLNGRTALLYACLKDRTDVARLLLRTPGIEVNAQDENGHTALLLAATKNSLEIFKGLLGIPGLNPDLRDRNGLTALSVAVLRGHNNIVQAFFPVSNTNLDISNHKVTMALFRAAVKSHVPIVNILLTSGSINPNVYIRGPDRLYEFFRMQLRYSARKHIDHAEGMTPLMIASSAGQTDVVKCLLTIPGIDVNLGNQPSHILVSYTSGSNDYPNMDSFLAGLDLKHTCFDCCGITALMFAAGHGRVDVLHCLLTVSGIDVNGQDCDGLTALMYASWMGYPCCVDTLLGSLEVDVNIQDKWGNTALTWASAHGRLDVVKRFLTVPNINVNIQCTNGCTALIYASGDGYCSTVDTILRFPEVDVNIQDNLGFTALSWASGNGRVEVVKTLLLVPGIKVNQHCINRRTALVYASRSGYYHIVDAILCFTEVDVNIQDELGLTALSWASGNGHLEVVKRLLSVPGIKVNTKDTDGFTALKYASQDGYCSIVDAILSFPGVNVNTQDKFAFTALTWASYNCHCDVVTRILSAPEVDANAQDTNGWTALMHASSKGYCSIVDAILHFSQVDVNVQDNYGFTALTWSCCNGHVETVKRLLAFTAIDINLRDLNGNTALGLARKKGYQSIVDILISRLEVIDERTALVLYQPIYRSQTFAHTHYGSPKHTMRH